MKPINSVWIVLLVDTILSIVIKQSSSSPIIRRYQNGDNFIKNHSVKLDYIKQASSNVNSTEHFVFPKISHPHSRFTKPLLKTNSQFPIMTTEMKIISNAINQNNKSLNKTAVNNLIHKKMNDSAFNRHEKTKLASIHDNRNRKEEEIQKTLKHTSHLSLPEMQSNKSKDTLQKHFPKTYINFSRSKMISHPISQMNLKQSDNSYSRKSRNKRDSRSKARVIRGRKPRRPRVVIRKKKKIQHLIKSVVINATQTHSALWDNMEHYSGRYKFNISETDRLHIIQAVIARDLLEHTSVPSSHILEQTKNISNTKSTNDFLNNMLNRREPETRLEYNSKNSPRVQMDTFKIESSTPLASDNLNSQTTDYYGLTLNPITNTDRAQFPATSTIICNKDDECPSTIGEYIEHGSSNETEDSDLIPTTFLERKEHKNFQIKNNTAHGEEEKERTSFEPTENPFMTSLPTSFPASTSKAIDSPSNGLSRNYDEIQHNITNLKYDNPNNQLTTNTIKSAHNIDHSIPRFVLCWLETSIITINKTNITKEVMKDYKVVFDEYQSTDLQGLSPHTNMPPPLEVTDELEDEEGWKKHVVYNITENNPEFIVIEKVIKHCGVGSVVETSINHYMSKIKNQEKRRFTINVHPNKNNMQFSLKDLNRNNTNHILALHKKLENNLTEIAPMVTNGKKSQFDKLLFHHRNHPNVTAPSINEKYGHPNETGENVELRSHNKTIMKEIHSSLSNDEDSDYIQKIPQVDIKHNVNGTEFSDFMKNQGALVINDLSNIFLLHLAYKLDDIADNNVLVLFRKLFEVIQQSFMDVLLNNIPNKLCINQSYIPPLDAINDHHNLNQILISKLKSIIEMNKPHELVHSKEIFENNKISSTEKEILTSSYYNFVNDLPVTDSSKNSAIVLEEKTDFASFSNFSTKPTSPEVETLENKEIVGSDLNESQLESGRKFYNVSEINDIYESSDVPYYETSGGKNLNQTTKENYSDPSFSIDRYTQVTFPVLATNKIPQHIQDVSEEITIQHTTPQLENKEQLYGNEELPKYLAGETFNHDSRVLGENVLAYKLSRTKSAHSTEKTEVYEENEFEPVEKKHINDVPEDSSTSTFQNEIRTIDYSERTTNPFSNDELLDDTTLFTTKYSKLVFPTLTSPLRRNNIQQLSSLPLMTHLLEFSSDETETTTQARSSELVTTEPTSTKLTSTASTISASHAVPSSTKTQFNKPIFTEQTTSQVTTTEITTTQQPDIKLNTTTPIFKNELKLFGNQKLSRNLGGETFGHDSGIALEENVLTGPKITEQTITKQVSTEETTTEQSTTEKSTTEQSTTEQSTIEQSTTEQSTTEQTTTEYSTTEDFTTEITTIEYVKVHHIVVQINEHNHDDYNLLYYMTRHEPAEVKEIFEGNNSLDTQLQTPEINVYPLNNGRLLVKPSEPSSLNRETTPEKEIIQALQSSFKTEPLLSEGQIIELSGQTGKILSSILKKQNASFDTFTQIVDEKH